MTIIDSTPQGDDMSVSRQSSHLTAGAEARGWADIARRHSLPENRKSILQLVTTVIPLVGVWIAMMTTVQEAYWLTLLLSLPAAALTVRLFAIQHDCGHRSFFNSRRLNDWLGNFIGIVTLTPHAYWRYTHNIHHATCGNLKKRGTGDISVLTLSEYRSLSRWKRLMYRLYRNPATLLGVGPLYLFVIKYRLPFELLRGKSRLLLGVMATNVAIAALLTGLSFAFGLTHVLMVQAPIVVLSSTAGVWLFYVQHQFEKTYWREDKEWNFHEASVMASSYYDLPQPLRWFSANIGLHHIHHLCSRIPNYRLQSCLDELPVLKSINRVSLWESLSCFRLSLWDEMSERLMSFRTLARREKKERPQG